MLTALARAPLPFAAPAIVTQRTRVRPLAGNDLPQLARIFRGVFRNRSEAGSKALERDLATSFLDHPHYDEKTCSLVYERATGEIGGFFGAMPLRMNFRGARRLGSVLSTWMVADRTRDARAGALLAQSHFRRRHACMIVDTANNVALGFAPSTKMSVLPSNSLQWVKPLSYLGYAVSSLGKRRPSRAFEALTASAEAAETLLGRMTGRNQETGSNRSSWRGVDGETFAHLFLNLIESYRLRPDWTPEFVQWMLSECGRRTSMGPLRLCEVLDRGGETIGCYAYHRNGARRAIVVQVVAARGSETMVLEALIEDARRQGCVAVCGAASPRLTESLFRIPNVFYRHTCTTAARADEPEWMQSLFEGDALVGGLVGDGWLPLTTESYD